MFRSIQPLQFLLTLLAGWINRQQTEVIEYLKEENRLLKERLGGRRLRFTDAERRRLARRAHALGRKALSELDTLVTPDTLMRWYRTFVAQKWTYTSPWTRSASNDSGDRSTHCSHGTGESILGLHENSRCPGEHWA